MGLSYQITHNRIVMNQERTLTFGKYKGTHRSNITGGFSAGDFEGQEGVFLKVKGARDRRVVIAIQGVIAVAMATIHPDLIEVIK